MGEVEKYEAVIGLEVHAQLMTASKIFSSDSTAFGASPNTQVSPITLGHPGTLPKLNEKVVEFAVMMGLACHCNITRLNGFARKNYFYADLPKGYQISQFSTPICVGGYIEIDSESVSKKIALTQIHIEEDAGKSLHDLDSTYSKIDLNRAGVPLIEIVSEPDMRSPDEAYQYVNEIRKIVRYLGICDGNMEEGSLRCDANISIRQKGETGLGPKVEVKNMNSVRNVKRAIAYEITRQIKETEKGNEIIQETRSFDAENGTTFSMRYKEMAHDYRYFPEPDLPLVEVTDEMIDEICNNMPALSGELQQKFINELGLTEYDAKVLTEEKLVASYFEEVISKTTNYKLAANWVMGPIKNYLNESGTDIEQFPVKPEAIASLIDMIETGKVSNLMATQRIFPNLLAEPEKTPVELAEALNLIQQSDVGVINDYVQLAIDKYPDKVIEYKNGKNNLIGLFMGEVMKMSKGKADPKVANKLLIEALNKN